MYVWNFKIFTTIVLLVSSIYLSKAQQLDSIHSPQKAAIYSTIIPGGGQLYNHIHSSKGKHKLFWKVPLIYGGIASTLYFSANNHITQRNLKKEYLLRIENGTSSTEYFPEFAIYDNLAILSLQRNYARNRDFLLFGLIAIYSLNVLDAFVEAHFIHFDISPDLSLAILPSAFNSQTYGINVLLNFR